MLRCTQVERSVERRLSHCPPTTLEETNKLCGYQYVVFLLARDLYGAVQHVQNQGIIMSCENISMPFHMTNCTSFWTNISSFPRVYLLGNLWGLRFSILNHRDVSHADSCHLIKSEKDWWTAFCQLAASDIRTNVLRKRHRHGTRLSSRSTAWCFSCFQRLRKAPLVKPTSYLL